MWWKNDGLHQAPAIWRTQGDPGCPQAAGDAAKSLSPQAAQISPETVACLFLLAGFVQPFDPSPKGRQVGRGRTLKGCRAPFPARTVTSGGETGQITAGRWYCGGQNTLTPLLQGNLLAGVQCGGCPCRDCRHRLDSLDRAALPLQMML